MSVSKPLPAPQLTAQVKQVLDEFLQAAKDSFGSDLVSAVLYGSAAEGKLQTTSDVNLVLVLSSFERNKADPLRAPLRIAQAAIQLRPMFLLKDEISAATRSFAPKFADILRRRVILFGEDPFAAISIPREIQVPAAQAAAPESDTSSACFVCLPEPSRRAAKLRASARNGSPPLFGCNSDGIAGPSGSFVSAGSRSC